MENGSCEYRLVLLTCSFRGTEREREILEQTIFPFSSNSPNLRLRDTSEIPQNHQDPFFVSESARRSSKVTEKKSVSAALMVASSGRSTRPLPEAPIYSSIFLTRFFESSFSTDDTIHPGKKEIEETFEFLTGRVSVPLCPTL